MFSGNISKIIKLWIYQTIMLNLGESNQDKNEKECFYFQESIEFMKYRLNILIRKAVRNDT